MNFQNLRYFCAVADELNITRAAEKLFISQQTLSGQIAKIEREYGAKLFERLPKLRLTYAGTRFLEFARGVVEREKSLQAELDDISGHQRGALSIGVTPGRSRLFLPQVLPPFMERYPNIQLDVFVDNYKTVERRLLEGRIDLMVCVLHEDIHPDVDVTDLVSEAFCAVVPRAFFDRFGADAKAGEETLSESGFWKKIPWIIANPQSQAHRSAWNFFRSRSISPHILFEVHDLDALFELAVSGVGATLLFSGLVNKRLAALASQNEAPVRVIPISLSGAPQRVVIGRHRGHYVSWCMKSFTALATEVLRRQVSDKPTDSQQNS